MPGLDASWRERPKRRRVNSEQKEAPAVAHPSGAAGSLLESCGNATHSAQAVDDVAAAGTALRRRGLQLPPLVVSDLPQLVDGDWDQLLASHDGVHTSSVDGWFARVRSTAAELPEHAWQQWPGPTRALHFLRLATNPVSRAYSAQCFSCGQLTTRTINAAGFCLFTCSRCAPLPRWASSLAHVLY